MKLVALYFIFLNVGLFSQSYKCDCIIKLVDRDLKMKAWEKNKEVKDYLKLPATNEKYTLYQIVKDSSIFWFIKTNSTEPSKQIMRVKKVANLLNVTVQFNGSDSIPIYSEPKDGSKIVGYYNKSKDGLSAMEKENGYEITDCWFKGCKNGYVKIDAPKYTGWIKKENYLNK